MLAYPPHHHHKTSRRWILLAVPVVSCCCIIVVLYSSLLTAVFASNDESIIVEQVIVDKSNPENNSDDNYLVCNDESSDNNANQCELARETIINNNSSSQANNSTGDPVCMDAMEDCAERAQDNGCIKDFERMKLECQATCLLCSSTNSTSSNDINEPIVNIYSTEPQTIAHTDDPKILRDYARRVDDYMFEQVYQGHQFTVPDRVQCKNRHAACTHWAATRRGECNINPGYMKLECAPACFSCDELKFSRRCAKYLHQNQKDEEACWTKPGDLNAMFERVVADPEYESKLQVLSRPHYTTSAESSDADVLDGPWVIVIDDFLTADECETMVQLGQERNYERSVDQAPDVDLAGNLKAVVTQHRTSSTAWCDHNSPCYQNATTQAIIQKMERLTNISDTNSEYLQLLKYDVGQSYGFHHDYTPDHLLRPQGPRILTIFCYLNDVEAGGGTRFSLLNLTVTPKSGRIVIWPSVLDESPMQVDDRTAHEALPVEKGVKYGVNAWIHQRDFKTPFANHCS